MNRLTILVENRVRMRGLQAEHGVSFWLELGRIRLLFDAGQSDLFLRNARHLGIDLRTADSVILSHGHYDHGGGLAFFPGWSRGPRLLAHPEAFVNKAGRFEKSGLPWTLSDRPDIAARLLPCNAITQVADLAWVLTDIPTVEAWEQTDPAKGIHQMPDEQLLVIDGQKGLTVILGCSHPGPISALRYVQRCFPGRTIDTVIGGLHLSDVSDDRLGQTCQSLKEIGIRRIYPMHCTGAASVCAMSAALGPIVHHVQTGSEIDIT